MSAWIKMIPEAEATGVLREMYDQAETPHGTVDNVMKEHSLRPHTMAGHVALYRSVLHHPDITLPLWFLEVIASYTSIKNKCAYSLTHHFMNARRLMNDEERADNIYA
ncbi:MAG: alkylhydroperoxidase, partial [Alphaproteobacteria bacterium]